MKSKAELVDLITPTIEQEGCFLVDLSISKDNEIEIIIDKDKELVSIENCLAVNKKFLELVDQEVEDYALTVGSSGDLPFKVLRQFTNAIGAKVEVNLRGGKRLVAILEDANAEQVTLKYSEKRSVEGKKKKEVVDVSEVYPMAEVNSIAPYMEF